MLDERKAAILEAVVTEYVRTAQPVGSAHVVQAANISVSPATVRHEMAVLERDGYLVQPHTSAGRVPTEKGYRHFVDAMGGRGSLGRAEQLAVGEFFSKTAGGLEHLLENTSRLLSELTDLAAVVVGPTAELATVRSLQLVGLSARVALVVVVLADGTVEKTTVELAEEVGDEVLADASAHLNRCYRGRALSEQPPVPATGDPVADGVAAAAVAALRQGEGGHDRVFVGGVSRMAAAFDAMETVRQVLGILEQSYVVVSLLQDLMERGLEVAIGRENGMESLAECTVIVAPYRAEGETIGTIGVLGPTRMNYPKALAAVGAVSQRLGRHLAEV